jgi:hypothetical protein
MPVLVEACGFGSASTQCSRTVADAFPAASENVEARTDSTVLLMIRERLRSRLVGVVVRLLESRLRVECWWQSCPWVSGVGVCDFQVKASCLQRAKGEWQSW